LEAEGLPSFRRVHRITGWVRFGGEIPCLADEVVAELMERWETINRQGGALRRFPPGEKVRIVSGSLQGLAQVVEEAKSPQARAKVLLQFMGRLVHAQVPWESLRPLDDQPVDITRIPRRTRGGGRWIRGFGPSALAGA
jgi:transcription antitermination factor NusG